jgi:VWFA-related protein
MPLFPVSPSGLCAIALLSLSPALRAQVQIPADEMSLRAAPYFPSPAAGIIRTKVELVEAPAVVRDSNGIAIPNLTREDFEVLDSGKKQEISTFSVETFSRAVEPAKPSMSAAPARTQAPQANSEPPRRYIALVLDDLNTDFASLRRGKTAAEKFVSEALTPRDLVGVFTTALSQTVEFTADVPTLRNAIEAVTPHARYSDELHECATMRAYEAYLIVDLRDAQLLRAKAGEFSACYHMTTELALRAAESKADTVLEHASANTDNTLRSVSAVVAAVGKMPGQRLVMLASSGFLSAGKEQELQALSSVALHNGVIVSGMDLRGLYTVVPGGDAATPKYGRGMSMPEIQIQARVDDAKDDGMAMLTSATGGNFFHNNNDLDLGFRRLGALPEVIYVLGFSPGDAAADGKYHPLKVRLTGGRHGSVEARNGYYASAKELPADLARRSDRDRILMGPDTPSDAPARIASESGASDTGPRVVTRVWIDVNRLDFKTKKDRRMQQVTVIAALLDDAGNFVVGRQALANLALKNRSFEALSPAGLTVSLSLHAPPGVYTLRVLVQEDGAGKRTAVSSSIRLQ